MFSISFHINNIKSTLLQGIAIKFDGQGNWKTENSVLKYFRTKEKSYYELLKSFIKELDRIETVPIYFRKPQAIDYQDYFEVGEFLLEFTKNLNSSLIVSLQNQLKYRIVALKYRLEKENNGIDPNAFFHQKLACFLHANAAAWKEKQAIYITPSLTIEETKIIQKIACYPEFIEAIKEDQTLLKELFDWALRDQIDPIFFIQYPALQKKLVSDCLSSRIGRLGGKFLQIEKIPYEEGFAKIVTLLFEGKPLNILDENLLITFRGNYKVTLRTVFEVFKNKHLQVGNFELLAEGIVNWNIHHLGWWNAEKNVYEKIDINQKNWWEQLPNFELLTREQAICKYGCHLNKNDWCMVASATRESLTLDYEKTHAFMEIAIPVSDNLYAIYDFGKLAFRYPANFLETLGMFCENVKSTIAFPDENVFYTHRQHAQHAFPITEKEGRFLMELIREDIVKSRKGNLIYQIESENCAKWVNTKLEEVLGHHQVPNLFFMPLLHTEPFGLMSCIFRMIKKLPKSFQVLTLTRLHLFIGASKETWIEENGEMVKKSLKEHEFWNTGMVYLPALMCHQVHSGTIPRFKARAIKENKTIYAFSPQKEELPFSNALQPIEVDSFSSYRSEALESFADSFVA